MLSCHLLFLMDNPAASHFAHRMFWVGDGEQLHSARARQLTAPPRPSSSASSTIIIITHRTPRLAGLLGQPKKRTTGRWRERDAFHDMIYFCYDVLGWVGLGWWGERGGPGFYGFFFVDQKRGRGIDPPQIFGPKTETYRQLAAKRHKTPQNSAKLRKTPQYAAKRRKTPQNAAIRRKTPQNAAKRRKTPQFTA